MSEAKLKRLRELSKIAAGDRDTLLREFTMRIPAQPDRDADLVLGWAAREIEELRKALSEAIEWDWLTEPDHIPSDVYELCHRWSDQSSNGGPDEFSA